jgi:hypothetical protein
VNVEAPQKPFRVVLKALLANSKGLTNDQVIDLTGADPKSVKSAITLLSSAALIYDSGERGKKGGTDIIWYAKSGIDPETISDPQPVLTVTEVRHIRRQKRQRQVEVRTQLDNLNNGVADKFLDCIRQEALERRYLSVDDVRRRFDQIGVFGSADARISGPAMAKARRLGWIVKYGHEVSDRRQSGLAHTYRSTLYPIQDELVETSDEKIARLEARIVELERENEKLGRKLLRSA